MRRLTLTFGFLVALGMLAGSAAQAGGYYLGYSPYGYGYGYGYGLGAYPLVGGTVYTPVPYGVSYAPPVVTYNVPTQVVTQVSNQEIVPTPAGSVVTQSTTVASPVMAPVPVTTTVMSPMYVAPAPMYAAPVYYGYGPRVRVAPLRGIVRIRY